jgi:excisionase family DNA binding protein
MSTAPVAPLHLASLQTDARESTVGAETLPSGLQITLTPADIATSQRVAIRTVQKWITTGKLRAHKAGRQWRVHPLDLAAFLAAGASTGQASA